MCCLVYTDLKIQTRGGNIYYLIMDFIYLFMQLFILWQYRKHNENKGWYSLCAPLQLFIKYSPSLTGNRAVWIYAVCQKPSLTQDSETFHIHYIFYYILLLPATLQTLNSSTFSLLLLSVYYQWQDHDSRRKWVQMNFLLVITIHADISNITQRCTSNYLLQSDTSYKTLLD